MSAHFHSFFGDEATCDQIHSHTAMVTLPRCILDGWRLGAQTVTKMSPNCVEVSIQLLGKARDSSGCAFFLK